VEAYVEVTVVGYVVEVSENWRYATMRIVMTATNQTGKTVNKTYVVTFYAETSASVFYGKYLSSSLFYPRTRIQRELQISRTVWMPGQGEWR